MLLEADPLIITCDEVAGDALNEFKLLSVTGNSIWSAATPTRAVDAAANPRVVVLPNRPRSGNILDDRP